MSEPTPDNPPPALPRNRLSTAALVLGLLSFVTGGCTAMPAIILGLIALAHPGGKGRAIGGITAAVLGFCVSVGVALPLALYAQQRIVKADVYERRRRVGIAFHGSESEFGFSPSGSRRTPQGEPGLAWRVDLLPHLGHEFTYRKLALRPDEPVKAWDSPEYAVLANTTIPEFQHLGDSPGAGTPVRGFVGAGTERGGETMFSNDPKVRFSLGACEDGLSTTIFAADAAERVPWQKADELRYSPTGPLPKLGGYFPGGFHAIFGDGVVRFIRDNNSESTLRALITRAGGEIYALDAESAPTPKR